MKKINISIFIFALFLSIFIWIIINLTQMQSVNIQMPISIMNAPSSLIPIKIEPKSINLTVEGRGDNIIKFNLKNHPYYLDLRNVHYGKNYIPFETDEISALKKYNLQITYRPHFRDILVVMDNMTTIRVMIKTTFSDEKSRDFFYAENFSIQPDEIQLKGPKKIISDIIQIETKPFNKKKHNENSKIALELPETNLINSNFESVEIVKKEAEIIQKIYSVLPITTPDSIIIFPGYVSLKVMGETKLLEKITKEDFHTQIKTSDNLQIGSTVPVEIDLPAGIKLVKQTPEKVKIREIKK